MALILVQMAQRRIEIGARADPASVAQLREHSAHHGGNLRIGGAFGHLDERQQMLLLLRIDPVGQARRYLLLRILIQRQNRAIQPDFGGQQGWPGQQRCDRRAVPRDAGRVTRCVQKREIHVRRADQFVCLHP